MFTLKSYNGLFDRMCDNTEIVYSIYEAAKDKTRRPYVQEVLKNPEDKATKIQQKFLSGSCSLPVHKKTFAIQEEPTRKVRIINKPTWDDEQIIHHCLMRQFAPIVMSKLHKHVYGSIPCRGPLAAMRTVRKWVKGYNGHKFYVFEGDVKKFYDHVDKDILKQLLSKTIRDKRYLSILFQVIDCVENGLPKGFYSSPWLANFYLLAVDNYILHVLKPDHYLRYMDNIYIFGKNKKVLHKSVLSLQAFMLHERKLELNRNWQIFRFEYKDRKSGKIKGRHINCLGFIIHYNRVTIRKTILERARAKANRMYRNARCRFMDARAIMSYNGYFKHTNTKRYYKKYILDKISIQYCRYRISKDSKRRATLYEGLVCS